MARRRILDVPADAIQKYEEFHRHEPRKVGEFPPSFVIPKRMARAGTARWVTYRSDKVDPETLRRPRAAVDYIHEHNAGVETYVNDAGKFPVPTDALVDVPSRFRDVALVRLGTCLGFCVERDGVEIEAASTRPMPDLYCTSDGRCLMVIQSRERVLAMMWGGALGVFARGIDG